MEDNKAENAGSGQANQEQSAQEERITLKVRGQDGEELIFKIRKNTELKKLIDNYWARKGIAATSCRFIYDGERIKPTNTADELQMEDGDEIDVMLEQTGGAIIL